MKTEILDSTTYYDLRDQSEKKKGSFWLGVFVGITMLALVGAVWQVSFGADPQAITVTPITEARVGEMIDADNAPVGDRDCSECAIEFVAAGGCASLYDADGLQAFISPGCNKCGRESAGTCIGTGRDSASCSQEFQDRGGCAAMAEGSQNAFIPDGCFDSMTEMENSCPAESEVGSTEAQVSRPRPEAEVALGAEAAVGGEAVEYFYDPYYDYCDCGSETWFEIKRWGDSNDWNSVKVMSASSQGKGWVALDFGNKQQNVDWRCDGTDWGHLHKAKTAQSVWIISFYSTWKWSCMWTGTAAVTWANTDYQKLFGKMKVVRGGWS